MRRPLRLRRSLLLASATALVCIAQPAHAQFTVFIGAKKVKSGDWHDPVNWDPVAVPSANNREAILILADTSVGEEKVAVSPRLFLESTFGISKKGALIVEGDLRIGTDIGNSTLTISGEDAVLRAGTVYVGHRASDGRVLSTGRLEISDKAGVSIAPSTVGSSATLPTFFVNPDSTVIVSGDETILTTGLTPTTILDRGSITVSGGALFSTRTVSLGSEALLTISGGKVFTLGASISGGTVTVRQGAVWETGSFANLPNSPISVTAQASGQLLIDGFGSTVTTGRLELGERLGGLFQTLPNLPGNAVTVSNGGRLVVDAYVRLQNGKSLVVEGTASLLVVNGNHGALNFGATRFTTDAVELSDGASLIVRDGGGASIQDIQLLNGAESAEVRVSGGTLLVAQNFDIGPTSSRSAPALLVIENAGYVRTGRANIGQLEGAIQNVSGNGRAVVRGAGTHWEIENALRIGPLETAQSERLGILTVQRGAVVSAQVAYLGDMVLTGGAANLGKGIINIGAAPDDEAVEPGFLGIATDLNIGARGTINFNHDGVGYSFATTVESIGFRDGLIAHYSGFTSLDGDMHRFTGDILVSGGSLDVNVEVGSALTTVRNGARLGGRGSLGGQVTIENGGTLAGAQGEGPLEMTTLVLSPGANLNIGLTGGDRLMPVFNVLNDLTLDGSINIFAPIDLGRGFYRIIDYGRNLIDRGLEIGTVSAGLDPAQFTVFTGFAGQVSLLYGNAVDPGDPGPVDPPTGSENRIGDGGGTIMVGGEGWMDGSGAAATLRAGDFAILAGPGTEITIDSGEADAVALAGVQFAIGGVEVGGDALAGSEDWLTLRVGDGTEAGTGFTGRISAPIVGDFGVEKTDLGTLVLTGANSYSGGTAVREGTLQGDTTSLQGPIDVDAALVFEQGSEGTFAGTLTGEGSVTKRGGGALSLSGGSAAFGGTFALEAGTLAVNGTLGGALTVGNGTRLGGNGTADAVVVASGGTLAPGNSIGRLSVGSIAFQPGSTYRVELNDGGNAAGANNDLLAVSGAAALGGTVHVTPVNPTDSGATYVPGTRYTILTAASVTGTFAGLTDDFAFLNFALSYSPTAVFLTSELARTTFCLDGLGANRCATGDGAFSTGGGALFDALLLLSDSQAPGALDQLSGEIHASVPTALLADARFARDAALRRLAAPEGGGAWLSGYGSWGDWDGDGNTAGFRRDARGAFLGADLALGDNARLGAFAGYGTSDLAASVRNSTAEAKTVQVGAYAGGRWGGFALGVGGAIAWHDVTTRRGVAFSGFSDSLAGAYDARTAQAFAEASYRLELGSTQLEPFARLALVSFESNGFAETGGAAALAGNVGDRDVTHTTLGLRAGTAIPVGLGSVRLIGSAAWQRTLGGRLPSSTNSLAGGDPFTVAGVPLARDTLALDAGLSANLGGGAAFEAAYAGQVGSSANEHGGTVRITVAF